MKNPQLGVANLHIFVYNKSGIKTIAERHIWFLGDIWSSLKSEKSVFGV